MVLEGSEVLETGFATTNATCKLETWLMCVKQGNVFHIITQGELEGTSLFLGTQRTDYPPDTHLHKEEKSNSDFTIKSRSGFKPAKTYLQLTGGITEYYVEYKIGRLI